MYYIYEKNLATGQSKLYETVSDKKTAERMVRDMNQVSLFEDKFYYIKNEPDAL